MSTYYEVVRLSENMKVFAQTIDVSKQRLTRAQYRFDYGQGNKLDVLNAEVDIQRDSINLLNIQQQLSNVQRNLNVIMGQTLSTPFQVDTMVNYAQNLNFGQLLDKVKSKNIAILMMDKNLGIT
ncbi:MAG: TolC family protein [Bacteroidetes bacterium]|jgi:outer membrane protein TolC|nr:TolC family protein [Bacteroidota bacterium]MDF1867046.1 TolC family protein [Saprospiraceae bacterium]